MTAALTDKRQKTVVEMTCAGYSADAIAATLGVSSRTIDRVRKKTGIAAPTPRPWTDPERRWATQLLDDGASYAEVGRTIGRPERSVRREFPDRGWTREQCYEMLTALRRYRQYGRML